MNTISMHSSLATPPYSTRSASPIIIPPPFIAIHDSELLAQHQRSFQAPGVALARATSQPASYQTKVEYTATTMVSPEIFALADLFGTLKHTLTNLSVTFGEIRNQTENMVSLGPATKAAEQVLLYASLYGNLLTTGNNLSG
jgi:hypothetical protein